MDDILKITPDASTHVDGITNETVHPENPILPLADLQETVEDLTIPKTIKNGGPADIQETVENLAIQKHSGGPAELFRHMKDTPLIVQDGKTHQT